ncbi:Uncharacterised protein [Bordetella pertussis]|nr:Uncharacterised protein [Bordetella pertussis]
MLRTAGHCRTGSSSCTSSRGGGSLGRGAMASAGGSGSGNLSESTKASNVCGRTARPASMARRKSLSYLGRSRCASG